MSDDPPEVLLWIRHPPYSTVHFSEAVRVAAMGSAMGGTYRLLFIADGVRALVQGQEAYVLGPPVEKTLQAIVTEDRPALVHLPSLLRRGLGRSSLVAGVPLLPVSDSEAAAALERADRVVPF